MTNPYKKNSSQFLEAHGDHDSQPRKFEKTDGSIHTNSQDGSFPGNNTMIAINQHQQLQFLCQMNAQQYPGNTPIYPWQGYQTQVNSHATAPPRYVIDVTTGKPLLDEHGNPITVANYLASKPLRKDLSTRPGPGNRQLLYISGEAVTRTLNEAFGYDGWSVETRSQTQIGDTEKDSKGRYHITYMSTVRITIVASGVYKEDVGTGDALDKDFATASSNAAKGSVTDAMKRAARYLGEKLGNTLYQDGFNIRKAPSTLVEALALVRKENFGSTYGKMILPSSHPASNDHKVQDVSFAITNGDDNSKSELSVPKEKIPDNTSLSSNAIKQTSHNPVSKNDGSSNRSNFPQNVCDRSTSGVIAESIGAIESFDGVSLCSNQHQMKNTNSTLVTEPHQNTLAGTSELFSSSVPNSKSTHVTYNKTVPEETSSSPHTNNDSSRQVAESLFSTKDQSVISNNSLGVTHAHSSISNTAPIEVREPSNVDYCPTISFSSGSSVSKTSNKLPNPEILSKPESPNCEAEKGISRFKRSPLFVPTPTLDDSKSFNSSEESAFATLLTDMDSEPGDWVRTSNKPRSRWSAPPYPGIEFRSGVPCAQPLQDLSNSTRGKLNYGVTGFKRNLDASNDKPTENIMNKRVVQNPYHLGNNQKTTPFG